MHCGRSTDPSPLAVPSLCPPLSHKHMGASLCQCPSQNTWLCLVTHGGQCTHTNTQDRHTYIHTHTHYQPCMTGISLIVPWCSPLRTSPPTVGNTHCEDTLHCNSLDNDCTGLSCPAFCSRLWLLLHRWQTVELTCSVFRDLIPIDTSLAKNMCTHWYRKVVKIKVFTT